MLDIYLTPASVSFLTQFILALAVTLFLLHRLRRRRDLPLALLSAFFALVTVFIGLMFLDAALSPFYRLLAVYAENSVLALALVALNAFAYRFPESYPRRKWEARIVLALSLAYFLWEAGFMIYRYVSLFGQGNVFFRPNAAAYAMAVVLLFAPIAFLRQSLAAEPRPVWLKLWKPEDRGARGARNFASVFAILFVLGLFNVLLIFKLPHTVYNAAMSIGALAALWLFAGNYVNFIPGGVNVASRLSILMLTLFLALLGSVGWLIAPSYIAAFQPNLKDKQTLRFTPNAAGEYEISEAELRFETEFGKRVRVGIDNNNRNHRLKFVFPFYGESYSEVYIANSGVISLGQPFWQPNLQAAFAQVPTLFPLMIDLDPNPAGGDGGLYIRQDSERLIVTWYRLPALYQPETRYTFQAVLYADGVFEFTYNGLPQPILFNPDATPSANPWLRGAVAGRGEPLHNPPESKLADGIAVSRSGETPPLENYQLAFRRYLHKFMLPVAWVVIGGSVSLLLAIPLLIRSSIIQPLGVLTEGARRMEAGEKDVFVPIQSEDEIGFLTGAFNRMSGALNDLVRNLEMRVAERTADLRKLSVAVEQSPSAIVITNLQAEIEYVNEAFVLSTGYAFEEVKGKNPRILQSGRTPPETFKEMWTALTAGKTWRGELANRRKNGEVYWEFTVIAPIHDVEGNVAHYVAIKEDVTARKIAEEKLEKLALTDALTGLLNRRGFFQEAEKIYARSISPPYELAALLIDIDHFKEVNDRYGHQAGDVALRELALCIHGNLRPTDLVARYGGEEFIALLPRASLLTLKRIARRLNNAVRERPIEYNGINFSVTVSIGGAMLTAESRSLEELLTQADQAMYWAKAAGRDCAVIFNQDGWAFSDV